MERKYTFVQYISSFRTLCNTFLRLFIYNFSTAKVKEIECLVLVFSSCEVGSIIQTLDFEFRPIQKNFNGKTDD